MVPADSDRIPRVPPYSGYRYASSRYGYRAITVSGRTFQIVLLTRCLATSRSYNPASAVTDNGLGSSPFARHYWGNHCLFSVPAGTKMFQFPALASIIDGWYLFKVPGCPIRKSADRRSFAPPRGLSQLITSFIASESQGIRHAPLLTFLVTFTHIFLNMCGMTYTSCFLAFSGNWFILLLVTSCHRAFCVECAESDRVRAGPAGSPAPLYRETNISAVQGSETPRR